MKDSSVSEEKSKRELKVKRVGKREGRIEKRGRQNKKERKERN